MLSGFAKKRLPLGKGPLLCSGSECQQTPYSQENGQSLHIALL